LAQDRHNLHQEIEKALNYEVDIDTSKVPGWVIGCIDGDSTWIFGFGRVSKDSNKKPDGNTAFEIGGVTKAYFSTFLYHLVKQGKLQDDAPINKYLRDDQQFAAGDKITLLQLMTHTSGLRKLPDSYGIEERDAEQPYAEYTEEDFFDFLKSIEPTELKTGKYLYSHLNHAVLEKIWDNVKGDYITSVFEQPVTYAQGYNLASKPVPMWQFNETFRLSLGLTSNTNKLLSFVKKNLGLENPGDYEFYRDTQKPYFQSNLDKNIYVARAWHVMKDKRFADICIQTGSTGGHSAFVAFVPETKTGVVVLANSKAIQSRLGMIVLQILNYNWKRESPKK
jgi:CubicO group peptidase (beta-lactamase class C family)